MKSYKTVQKRVLDKIYCDICGSCCTDDFGDEYALLEAAWGYNSSQDGTKFDIQICENCFNETLVWMRQKRKFYLDPFNYPHDQDPLKGKS